MSRGQGWLLGFCLLLSLPAQAGEVDALFAARMTDLDGKAVLLSKWQGTPLVVNFWARWCGPCKKEIPDLAAMQAAHKNVTVAGIAIEDVSATERIKDFAKAYDINYAVIVAGDEGLKLMRSLGNDKAGLPFTIAINRQGRVVARKLGLMTRPEMEQAFRKAQD